ncbi:MMPL family transporter [Actinomadura macrotermitis]|uniref:Trehalose monomycolate exporter MmpL3 n=1 Tax=Actinomadura macrotermitis TaxID=2585200 RepID=A0A7K0BQV4_9ACTN|nr:MMPL family transporter [Actinomadura macrotermitis]MQY03565.1 Trehalose monomycolate exporter MmpL3 [Actinomadura macrotermitis]
MFESWGHLMYRRRRPVLLLAAAFLVVAAVWGTGVFGALTSGGGFDTPGSESDRAARTAARDLGRDQADLVVLYRSTDGRKVDDPAYRQAVQTSLAALPPGKAAATRTYWTTGAPQFVSADRTATYAVLSLAGADDAARADLYQDVKDGLARAGAGLTVKIGGRIGTETAINDRVSADIGRAEAMAMPVLLVLLVLIFGGLVSASLPLVVGGLAILGSFTALHLLTYATDVSIFAINITTFLGLGLAIDYGLFMVGRFREELARDGASTEDALAATVATAGRTVAVSGITVAVSLAGLLLFDQNFLRSMGYGGVATVFVCMLGALTVLPALLAVLGPRVNALRVRGRRAETAPAAAREGGWWYRLAHSVMRRPVVYTVATVALLLALGAPFLRINWGGVDAEALPKGTDARVVTEALRSDFPGNVTDPIEVVVTGTADQAAVKAYAARLDALPGVTGATVTGAKGATTRLALAYSPAPHSDEARALVGKVRAVAPPPGGTALVGGSPARVVDLLDSLAAALPWLALTVGGATFVLLFLAFGSVVLPLKAVLMNLLSLSATFGAIVVVFQDGHLSGLLDFTATGSIDPTMPILMLAMLFGISMDYEVFLLSRVREQYDLTGDNTAAVATGLQRTGGVITSAALLFVVVIGAFATSGISFIKLVGVGMVIAIAVDATVVRALLVPATMRLLGRANWWAPGPLARVYRRYGIREEEAPARRARPEPVSSTP